MIEKNQFQGKRLNESLGNNELREYLANKAETSLGKIAVPHSPDFRYYKKPILSNIEVLLIAPPITIPQNMIKRCIPPLGLSYIAGFIESAGYNISMIDCVVEGYEQEMLDGNLLTYGLTPQKIEQRLRLCKPPDVVCTSVLFSTDLNNLFALTRRVRNVFPETIIVVGGLHPTIYPKDIFEIDQSCNGPDRTVDFVFRGEGEHRIVEFLSNLKQGKIDRNADGLVGFINDEFFCNHQRSTIDNLDELPFPAYHLLPMERYFEINVPFSPVPQGSRVAQVLTSRGCPVSCTFCASTNMYKKFRYRSVENVIAEIKDLKERYGIDEVQFADDNLTLDRKHSIEFFTALRDVGIKWCTPNGTMINTLTPELMDLMAQSGLYQITLSLDSGSARTLKELHHKPVNLNSIPGLIAKAKEYGIFTHGTLVVGMPGETIEDIEEGFNFVKNHLAFTSISVFIATAIPGSELYHQALEKKLITKEDAHRVNFTKSRIHLANIDPLLLEERVKRFYADFTEIAKKRDPEEYYRKYSNLIRSKKNTHFIEASSEVEGVSVVRLT